MSSTRAVHVLGACLVLMSVPGTARAQLPAGPEFRVNEFTIGNQRSPSPAFFADGGFLVSWTDGAPVGSGPDIFARRYSAAGTPLGAAFQANTDVGGVQWLSAAAAAPEGRFVVAWTGYDGSGYGIRLRAYDAQGAPTGPEVPVNTVTFDDQWFPVAASGGGGFIVAWQSFRADGMGDGVAVRLLDAGGAPRGNEFVLNTYTTFGQFVSAVAGWRGGFVVTWSSPHFNGEADIYARRLDREGAPLGAEFVVNATTAGYQANAAAAMADDGSFVVAWESRGLDGTFGIFARAFGADGTPLGPDAQVNVATSGAHRFPAVAGDGQGGLLVSWESFFPQEPGPDGSRGAVFARRLAPRARPLGAEFRVNTYTTGDQAAPSAAGLRDGRAVITWFSNGQDGNSGGVFGQRYGSMAPLVLDVDAAPGPSSDGNGVFEPGESAIVAPHWRNLNTAAVALTGTAFAFGGPGTPPYVIVDGAAAYGTVAPNANASCTDCYVLSVGPPAPRPATHWDARFDEDLSLPRSASWRVHLGDSFSDVPSSSSFYRFVETVLHHGVAGGCGAASYCPGQATTREQMAPFLLVAREGNGYVPPACAPPNVFEDVPESSPYCRWIEELARRGITGGCDATHYCPSAGVTREQMAVFVLRALDQALNPPACTTPVFNDVPAASPFCRWIEELARRGVVSGCGGGNYCPAVVVRREEMAVFLAATFSLALYPA